MFLDHLQKAQAIGIIQRKENLEIFTGFETRNKYEIKNQVGENIGFAAEQGKGFLYTIRRFLLKSWRPFNMTVFDMGRKPVLHLHSPFRFYFNRLQIKDASGRNIGAIQRKFGIFFRRFEIENAQGHVISKMKAPFFKLWTFPIVKDHQTSAHIRKKWGGGLREIFTDADTFVVEFDQVGLPQDERCLITSAAFFVDTLYFESNQGVGGLLDLVNVFDS